MKKPKQMFLEPESEYRFRCLRWLIENYPDEPGVLHELFVKHFADVTERTFSRALMVMRVRNWAQRSAGDHGIAVYESTS